ncbi:MAG: 16S rRNA (guanine(966)-N(2))-methyltransferase RsmD [Pseudomonadota bacterium]
MRITAGKWRSRVLQSPDDDRVRPTADKVRQAAFNTLHSRVGSFADTHVLDLFCGSGIMALEALSRGAETALAVDSHPHSIELTQRNATVVAAPLTTLRVNIKDLPPRPDSTPPFDIAFADPPYQQNLGAGVLVSLASGKWLQDQAWVVVETEAGLDLDIPPEFTLDATKTYGKTTLWFLQFHAL